MIKSDIVKIKYTNDNAEIERALIKMGIDPLRWAVVKVLGDELELSVSFNTSSHII